MNTRKLIAGNWKMYGSLEGLAELDAIDAAAATATQADVALCVPFTLIAAAAARARHLAVGAQDVDHREAGAHTGNVSAAMLREAGASLTIVGHSERRTEQKEDDRLVRAKAEAAARAGLGVVLCVGETLAERDGGQAEAVVRAQLAEGLPADRSGLTVAYEPVWAIGTGRTPTEGDIAAMHAAIRAVVGPDVRVLYGGSVKPSNATAILRLPDVDGALVGGASLTAADFIPIIAAAG